MLPPLALPQQVLPQPAAPAYQTKLWRAMKNLLFALSLLTLYTPVTTAADTAPLVFAHRGASGLWLQNSRYAVQQSQQFYRQNPNVFDGIELDVVLSKDLIPVLSHDPWIHQRLCQRRDGKPLGTVLLKDVNLTDLQRDYECGHIADKDFPNASAIIESVLDFGELLSMLQQTPTLAVYLDLKIEPPLTAQAGAYAQAIFSHWATFGLSNPLYIEAPTATALNELKRFANRPFTAVLSYPAFRATSNATLTGAMASIRAYLQPRHAAKHAQRAGAAAIAAPTQVANKRLRQNLQAAGIKLIVFTPNTAKAFAKACRPSSHAVISDYPNLGPCS